MIYKLDCLSDRNHRIVRGRIIKAAQDCHYSSLRLTQSPAKKQPCWIKLLCCPGIPASTRETRVRNSLTSVQAEAPDDEVDHYNDSNTKILIDGQFLLSIDTLSAIRRASSRT